jgi:hypothetical protein
MGNVDRLGIVIDAEIAMNQPVTGGDNHAPGDLGTPSLDLVGDMGGGFADQLQVAQSVIVGEPARPPDRRLLCGSCSSGQGFAYSFLPTLPHANAVAVQLGVPATKAPQRTCTSQSLPGSLSLPG